MKPVSILRHGFVGLVAVWSVFPFVWMAVAATNSSADVIKGRTLPGGYLIENIQAFMTAVDLPRVLWNSAIISGLGTVLTLTVSALAGYGFEMFRSRFRERVFAGLMLMLSIPFAALMIPLFVMMAKAKLINSYSAVILPMVASVFVIFYFRQATKAFPRELRDAAKIDGLSEWQIFAFVYVPVMRSTFAAATIIVFMANWNNYLWPLVVLQTNDKFTLTLAVASVGIGYTPDYGLIMVGAIAATLPTLLIFFLLQRRFVEGMLGAVK